MRDVEGSERVGGNSGSEGPGKPEPADRARSRGADVDADPPLVASSWLLLAAWAFLVQVLAVRAFAGGVLPSPPPVVITPCQIDVNRAGVAELQALPSVGPSRAEAIVLERIRHGRFADLADLSRVRGFGPEMLARLAKYVRFEPESGR